MHAKGVWNALFLDGRGKLTHSAAPSPAFEGGVKKRRSGSTLSKPQHLCWGVEGLTFTKEADLT
ncbi:MAG: hypothetical protein COZ69_03685 [Deltaproteobacteria bacterium CG_4_8_14_3_um_filter_45_9]|nr:MAG: hypothetical protein COS40_03275 [Deltaproteobacteria bacterium CG03_land_8_20_14_0_80_45_14]PIX25292.1 MAG: hypothetical protein COZ69_03685 [Deltaproteobacteria bacterium CG_4_8_14_3_um_filter_45_9]